jgi:hypothetical protein
MNSITHSDRLANDLIELVQANIEQDAPFGGWMVDEGQRVLGGAQSLLSAIRSDSAIALLNKASVIDYLGRSWLEVHNDCHSLAEVLQSTFAELPSNSSCMDSSVNRSLPK